MLVLHNLYLSRFCLLETITKFLQQGRIVFNIGQGIIWDYFKGTSVVWELSKETWYPEGKLQRCKIRRYDSVSSDFGIFRRVALLISERVCLPVVLNMSGYSTSKFLIVEWKKLQRKYTGWKRKCINDTILIEPLSHKKIRTETSKSIPN